jgi:hypothetical protein
MLLSFSGAKPKDLPDRIRMFEHPGRPDPQETKKELTTDEAEIRAFFKRMGGR